MKKSSFNRYKLRLIVTLLFVFVSLLSSSGLKIEAASLTTSSIRFNRMRASTATTFRITFTVPAGNSQTESDVRISFPDAYTVATSSLTATTVGCGATALPGTLSVVGSNTGGSKNITISGVTNLAATTSYCVDVDRATTSDPIINPTAGPYTIGIQTRTASAAAIDTASIGVRVVSDDQVVVSAIVPPSFNFVLDGNSTSFVTDLDFSSVVQTTPRTVTITTNATSGWVAWARDSNTGLTSAAAGKTINSTTPGTAATLASGVEGYVLGVQATDAGGGGSVAVTSAYQGTGADSNGSGLDTTFRQIASANGTANGDVLTLRGKAGINAFTPAGVDYTDTWTIIGAGSF